MQIFVVQRIVGLLSMIFSLTMLPPILVSLFYRDGATISFIAGFLVTLIGGMSLWFPVRRESRDLRLRDGFIVVVSFWAGLGLLGSVPLMFGSGADLGVTDAVFESVSGLTTTGATVIVGLDTLPPSILYYRQQLQWLGGMGIIVLAVAILPMLGVGGMQLYRAETPGPIKDSKLTPRITQTAKALWYIYLGLTVLCGLAYWAAGMTPFDALGHAFSTVAIGGFSTHDASLGFFDNPLIPLIAIVFMLISGVNFALHFMAFRHASLTPYRADYEFRMYIAGMAVLSVATCGYLWLAHTFEDMGEVMLAGIFHAVSIGTTTGFTTASFHTWPGFLPVLLLFASFVGGCAGSTGGGIKVIRFLLLLKQGFREINRLIHPNAQLPVKIGSRVVTPRVIEAVYGFFSAYIIVFAAMLLFLMATGLDQITAFSAVAACLNNLGPGLGQVAAHYGEINDLSKWVLVIAMILGRLEIFTLLVIITPMFWQR
ncbi:MAG: TrkH family potassium uptake protein [Pseudomonadota bacterium]|nr:TrkH family potassium uptake protein [Pseudomonadota bacterium]